MVGLRFLFPAVSVHLLISHCTAATLHVGPDVDADADNDEDATDEISALQTSVQTRIIDEEEGIDEDDGDGFSAMQTEIVMLGRVGGARHEDELDESSFLQSQTEVIGKGDRNCDFAQSLDEEDDAVSLIQTEVAVRTKEATSADRDDISLFQTDSASQAGNDDTSVLVQKGIVIKRKSRQLGAKDDAEERGEQDETMLMQSPFCKSHGKAETKKYEKSYESLDNDDTSFLQTKVTLTKGRRKVGKVDVDDDEDALGDGIAFVQSSLKLKHGDHVPQTGELNLERVEVCNRGHAAHDDEDENDEFSL